MDKKSPEYLAKRRAKYQETKHMILPKLAEIRKNNPKKYMLKDAKKRAKEKGIEFSITECDFNIPEYCPISLLKLKTGSGKLIPESPTLDRIDNSKGYVKGNVAVISNRSNSMKRDATLEEIQRMVKYMETTCS